MKLVYNLIIIILYYIRMKLDKDETIKNIREKMTMMKIPNLQQFETYSNVELIKVCRLFYVQPIYK